MHITITPLRVLHRFLAFAGAALLIGQPALAQARRFSADDLPRIVRLSDPQLSPDGKSVAVVIGRDRTSVV
jgi:hypothetical protein